MRESVELGGTLLSLCVVCGVLAATGAAAAAEGPSACEPAGAP